MEARPTDQTKPKRLYYKTYLQLIKNSVGTEMFKNFYVLTADGKEIDAMSDGSDSCAFYVSAVLTLFRKHSGIHGTIGSTLEDLDRSGWRRIERVFMKAGDVVLWEAAELDGRLCEHVGFYIGDGRAVSTSWTKKMVVEHDVNFDGKRAIEQVFRYDGWD